MAIDKVTQEIHRIMEEGKKSRLHGWTMRDIVSKITASFGEEAGAIHLKIKGGLVWSR